MILNILFETMGFNFPLKKTVLMLYYKQESKIDTMKNHSLHSFINWRTMPRPLANKAKVNGGIVWPRQWMMT
jgi:hypothetical protein